MQNFVSLEITARIDGAERTGVFEIVGAEAGKYTFESSVRTGYLVEGGFSNIMALFKRFYEDSGGGSFKQGVHISLGSGERAYEVDFNSPGESTTPDGTVAQWGSSGDPTVGPNKHTATGASKETQMAVLHEYLGASTLDGLSPATLSAYEWSTSGIFDPLTVAIEQPTMALTDSSPSRFDGSLTMVETTDLNETWDALENDGK